MEEYESGGKHPHVFSKKDGNIVSSETAYTAYKQVIVNGLSEKAANDLIEDCFRRVPQRS